MIALLGFGRRNGADRLQQLSFAGVPIATLAEGEIGELLVGVKGTMNQPFLKDLADETRRGQRGRVEARHSGGGNCYGYGVFRLLGPDGDGHWTALDH